MKKIWVGWLVSLLALLALSYVNLRFFNIPNLLSIQFARTQADMHACISNIARSLDDSYRILYYNTLIDYLYLVAYIFLTWFSIRITFDALETKGNKYFYLIAFIPGFFDAIENVYLLQTALEQREVMSGLYKWAVRIKWGTAILPIMLIPIVMVYGLIIALRAKQAA